MISDRKTTTTCIALRDPIRLQLAYWSNHHPHNSIHQLWRKPMATGNDADDCTYDDDGLWRMHRNRGKPGSLNVARHSVVLARSNHRITDARGLGSEATTAQADGGGGNCCMWWAAYLYKYCIARATGGGTRDLRGMSTIVDLAEYDNESKCLIKLYAWA